MKQCVLRAEKTCTNCGECEDRCELDPQKICDNCFRCLETDQKPFLEIPITGVYFEDDFTPEPALPVELALDEDEEPVLDSDDSWREEFHLGVSTLNGATASRVKRRHIRRYFD